MVIKQHTNIIKTFVSLIRGDGNSNIGGSGPESYFTDKREVVVCPLEARSETNVILQ